MNKPGENSISESFETLDGLYTYLFSKDLASNVAKLYGTSDEDIAEYTQLFEGMQNSLRSHNFVWSEVPLPDYQIGVVFNESGSTYEYYLYDGEEWIKLENKNVVTVTKNIQSGSPIDTQLAALTFTFDEVNSLKSGAELNIEYALNSQQMCTAYAQKVCTVTSDDEGILTYDLTFYPTDFTNSFILNTFRLNINTYNNPVTTTAVQTQTIIRDSATIPVSAWTEAITSNYNYKATVNSFGKVLTQSIVLVFFSRYNAEHGNFSPYVDTFNGGFYIYCKQKPSEDINLNFT